MSEQKGQLWFNWVSANATQKGVTQVMQEIGKEKQQTERRSVEVDDKDSDRDWDAMSKFFNGVR